MIKTLTKFLLKIIGAYMAFYIVISIAVYFAYPSFDRIDTNQTFSSFYPTEEAHLITGRRAVMDTKADIFILGASGSRKGFPSSELEKYIKDVRVNNVSIDASNMKQMSLATHLIYEAVPEDAYSNATFIISSTYHYYLDDSSRWSNRGGMSNLEWEMEKYGLYKKNGEKWEPNLPPFLIKYSDFLLLPHFFFNKLPLYKYVYSTRAENNLRLMGFSSMSASSKLKILLNPSRLYSIITTPEDTNKTIYSEQDKDKAMAVWEERFSADGGLGEKQFAVLKELSDYILSRGSSVVIVDMPIPEWQHDRSIYYKKYQQMKQPYIQNILSNERAYYINMQDLDNNDDFMNSSHPRKKTVKVWCKRLYEELKKQGALK